MWARQSVNQSVNQGQSEDRSKNESIGQSTDQSTDQSECQCNCQSARDMQARMLVNLKAYLFDNIRCYINQIYNKHIEYLSPGEFRSEEAQLSKPFREALRDLLDFNGSSMEQFDQEYYDVIRAHVKTHKTMFCRRKGDNLYEIAVANYDNL